MKLPEDKHPEIFASVLDKLQEAVPDKLIQVACVDIICRDTEESLHLHDDGPYRFRLIPATESFIQALEEASPVDDDEVCAICRDMFAQNKDSSSSITKLPCSHYYHRDCIVAWLRINHLCPTCGHRNLNAPSS
ncbi:E3 ubiquitin-protein ligase RING1-like [Argentina anserina]|uniref:E3 ubiquitin-protein ligase RING1-like n=1 Tax=Argentina anserina TaxID=57926 RepID=UPI0021763910|nr:E3 ubiquitin-protein ligase RING1-like [Potentilla anserina]